MELYSIITLDTLITVRHFWRSKVLKSLTVITLDTLITVEAENISLKCWNFLQLLHLKG
jgi:hypothetical protein